MDWVERTTSSGYESHVATVGYTRLELYKPKPDKGYTFATYSMYDSALNWSRALRTKDLEAAKHRALKRLRQYFVDKRDDYDNLISQVNDGMSEIVERKIA